MLLLMEQGKKLKSINFTLEIIQCFSTNNPNLFHITAQLYHKALSQKIIMCKKNLDFMDNLLKQKMGNPLKNLQLVK